MGFSRQEYWSGLPFPSPKGRSQGIFPNQGLNPALLFYILLVLLPFGLYWGLWELFIYVIPASTIPLHFSLGWI